jgi:hypothetical protein
MTDLFLSVPRRMLAFLPGAALGGPAGQRTPLRHIGRVRWVIWVTPGKPEV